MNRYAQVLTASALAYTAQASAAAKWARGTTMSSPPQFIATAEQLVALTKEPRARHLVVCGNIANVPTIRLIRITTVGQVQLLARDTVRSGHVEVDRLDITSATLGHESTTRAALAP